MREVICCFCNKDFKTKEPEQKYCSSKCSGIDRRVNGKIITIECNKCNVEFSYQLKNSDRRKSCDKCKNSRTWSKEDKEKKSISAKNSSKVQQAIEAKRGPKFLACFHCVCGKELIVLPYELKDKKYCSRECYVNYGTHINDRHWRGTYQGYKYDSGYELTYLIYCLENEIPIERNLKSFTYSSHGNPNRKYTPDFYHPHTREYIEIKGQKGLLDDDKWKQFPLVLKILFQRDLLPYHNYCTRKYGENFWRLNQFGGRCNRNIDFHSLKNL